ncbi:MAG: asparagine synthase (glutamine-hydrolyzing) [Oligoflexia bacterium]|nr:asparagine synthase (glutamine-hydrolyzing) [Oligoflexia bacterium]
MCGIFGHYSFNAKFNIDRELIERCTDLLSHRGPDGRGVFYSDGVALGHRRLSIIDLSDRASQPMSDPEGKVFLTFNGEIYNFIELRRILQKDNHYFITDSDSEVLLHAYLEWGIECVHKLRGIFAFAIWDNRDNKRRLYLCRDHVGVKPLYYSIIDGTIFFSSEISPLLAIPNIHKDPDYYGIDCFFSFSYIPAPLTGYKYIKQLEPANYLMAEQGKVHIRKYWDLPFDEKGQKNSDKDHIHNFEELFTSVVKRQMVSDVPVGTFLSSGVDSFAITRAVKKINQQDVLAFSIGFESKQYDELPFTKMAADTLGIKLISKRFPQQQDHFNKLVREVIKKTQDPFADSSSLPVYFLSKVARENVKVVLSGDGADELLGGYSVYRANDYIKTYLQIPTFIRKGLIKPFSAIVPDRGGKYTFREKIKRFIYCADQEEDYRHTSWRVILRKEQKKLIYTSEFYKQVEDFNPLDLYAQHIKYARLRGRSELDSCLYADFKFFLPSDMLVKVDRMSMANGLEVRVPFLDVDLVEFCWQLPDHLKINNGQQKYILCKMISDQYPNTLKKRPKSGFNVEPNNLGNYKENVDRFILCKQLHKAKGISRYSDFLLDYCLMVMSRCSFEKSIDDVPSEVGF